MTVIIVLEATQEGFLCYFKELILLLAIHSDLGGIFLPITKQAAVKDSY